MLQLKRLLLITLNFTILGCSKDDDITPPNDPDLCNCIEEEVHRRQNGNIVFESRTPFISKCMSTTVETEQLLDVTITTTISCTRP